MKGDLQVRQIKTFNHEEMWYAAAAFHGHECPGLAIGFRAVEYAMGELSLDQYADDDLLTVVGRSFCGVDAFQVILGTTMGKNNLRIIEEEVMSFTVYNKKNGDAIRIVVKPGVMGAGPSSDPAAKEARRREILAAKLEDILLIDEVKIPLADL